MAIKWEYIDESTRVAAQPGTVAGLVVSAWSEHFSFRQESPGDVTDRAFCLRAYVPGTDEHAVVSYRRARTLEMWCDQHMGEKHMLITPNDLFSFTTEAEMVMFATVWNGVTVPMCSREEVSR